MTVLKVLLETATQIFGQSDVVQLVSPIERVHSVSPPHDRADDGCVSLERIAGEVFDVLTN